MKPVILTLIFNLFSLILNSQAKPTFSDLPHVMREILNRHPSFSIRDSGDSAGAEQKVFIGAAPYRDRAKHTYWLSLAPDNYLRVYDCTRPENIIMYPAFKTGEPAIDIKTYYNFAYVLTERHILVLNLAIPFEADILREIAPDDRGEAVNLWVHDNRLFVLLKDVLSSPQSRISVYSLQNPVKPKPVKTVAFEISQPVFFYVAGDSAFIREASGKTKKIHLPGK